MSADLNPLLGVLARISADLTKLGAAWALIGGWAVGVRAEPRTTRDVDVVVAVENDRAAEKLIRELRAAGYRLVPPLRENIALERLAMARMSIDGINVDLMFAFSGIEPEVVAGSELIELVPGISAPVANRGHLMALKASAGRPIDLRDLKELASAASEAELQIARESLALIAERGVDPVPGDPVPSEVLERVLREPPDRYR